MQKLSDRELQLKTVEFKERLNKGGETLDNILPEAFAVAREASYRVLGMKHFRVQLMGGIILHQGGRISEMKTGGRENPSSHFASLFKCSKWKRRSYCYSK